MSRVGGLNKTSKETLGVTISTDKALASLDVVLSASAAQDILMLDSR